MVTPYHTTAIDLLSTRDWSCFVCQGKCPKESHWELNAPPATEAPPAAIVEAGTTSEEEYYEEGASGTVSTRKRSRRGPATPEQTAANVSFAPSVPTSAENNDRTGIKIRLPGRKSAKKPGSGSAELPATSSPPSGFPAPIDVQHTSPFGASAGYYGAGPSYPYAIPTPAQMLQMQQMQQTMAAASQMVAMQRLSTTSVGVSTADDPAGLAMGQTPAPLSSLEPQVAEYINDLQKRYLEVQYANERYREQLEGLTNVINVGAVEAARLTVSITNTCCTPLNTHHRSLL